MDFSAGHGRRNQSLSKPCSTGNCNESCLETARYAGFSDLNNQAQDLKPSTFVARGGMSNHISPYHAPDFYSDALSKGRHRDIVGGRWEETGRIQMALLQDEGLRPEHHLLDVGAGALRLGCKAVTYLEPGHYWATDYSGPLLLKGYEVEISDKSCLSPRQLVEDRNFDFPGIPEHITHILAFAVFTHLPANHLRRALIRIKECFPNLQKFMFTVFLAPDVLTSVRPVKQPDGVVTHDTRAPYHLIAEDVLHFCAASGFSAEVRANRLPRGQVLIVAQANDQASQVHI